MASPIDIVSILTAATPIVASIANNFAKKSENEYKVALEEKRASVPVQQPNYINITINNNFYVASQKEALHKSQVIEQDLFKGISLGEERYSI